MTPDIFQSLLFFLNGFIARSLAVGHWTDWTERPAGVLLRMVLMLFAWCMFAYGFLSLGILVIGVEWTTVLFLVLSVLFLRDLVDDDF